MSETITQAESDREAPAFPTIDPRVRIGHVHLKVADLQRALDFYCGVLGFTMTTSRPGAAFISAGGYHHHLGLNTWAGVGAPPPPEHAVGLRGFTIESAQLQDSKVVDPTAGLTVSLVHAGHREIEKTTS